MTLTITCRRATFDDLAAVLRMARAFAQHGTYAEELADATDVQFAGLFDYLTAGPADRVLLVADAGEGAVGMLGAVAFADPLTGAKVAQELCWWVDPEARTHGTGRLLLKAAEGWARDVGARRLRMIAPTPQIGTLYERWGYTPVETLYSRRV